MISRTFCLILTGLVVAAALARRPLSTTGPLPGFMEAEIAAVLPDVLTSQKTVILKKKYPAKQEEVPRVLMIWVGDSQGDSISLGIAKAHYPRPLTHDLMAQILRRLNARVNALFIHSLHKNTGTFFARLEITRNSQSISFDCRPSDGMALALRANAPIYIKKKLFQENSVTLKIPTGFGKPRKRKRTSI